MKHYLGPGIIGDWGILPYSNLFNIASYQHDIGFEKGGNSKDKKRIDKMFLKLMLVVSKTKTQIFFAYFYYYMVRIFGFLFFNYN